MPKPSPPAVTLRILCTGGNPMELRITEQVTCTLDARDAQGNPAPLDGVPEWATSNPAVAAVHPAADGWTAVVTATSPGTTTITAIGDADLKPNKVRELTATQTITVVASEAETLTILVGTPEPQP